MVYVFNFKHVYTHQDTINAKKPADAKQKKKGMVIACEIEHMTPYTNLKIDYSLSGDDIDHLAESSCSEDEEINMRKPFWGLSSNYRLTMVTHNRAKTKRKKLHTNHVITFICLSRRGVDK